jgi:hypothetical protein
MFSIYMSGNEYEDNFYEIGGYNDKYIRNKNEILWLPVN